MGGIATSDAVVALVFTGGAADSHPHYSRPHLFHSQVGRQIHILAIHAPTPPLDRWGCRFIHTTLPPFHGLDCHFIHTPLPIHRWGCTGSDAAATLLSAGAPPPLHPQFRQQLATHAAQYKRQFTAFFEQV
eukprot:scaffold18752_cov67-Isochrysis_galbana.AAC.1